jgi:glutaredoxin
LRPRRRQLGSLPAALIIAIAALLPACREGVAADDAAPGPAPIRFTADEPIELVYADAGGAFRTAYGLEAVPESARSAVRVVVSGPETDRVHLADLTRPDADGQYTTELVSAAYFERRALVALAPGAASRVTLPPPADAAAPGTGGVVVYGTAWCGACAAARDHLDRRRVSHRFRDVERDPRAGAQLAAALAALGARADRVPVIDLHGRLLIGFEPTRLDTLLGESL